MQIGKKFNLLIIGAIAAVFVAIGIFVLIYIPVVNMRTEKDSIYKLDSAISELRADINKLPIATFDDQMEQIINDNDILLEQFKFLEGVEYLTKDEEIAKALKIITRLYSLYEVNYRVLTETADKLSVHLVEVFLTDKFMISDIKESPMFQRYEEKETFLSLLDRLLSVVSTLDSNLISTHMVVIEKFELIDNLIDARERQAYIFGIALIFIAGITAFLFSIFIAARISKNIQKAGRGIERMSTGDISESFHINSKDEMGELGNNLNILRESLKSAFSSMKTGSNQGVEINNELISSAHQTSAAAAEIAANSQAISQQFQMLSEKVVGALDANSSLNSSLQALEGWVQDQAAMVEESTASVTEMISSINNVTEITTRKKAATVNLVKTSESGGHKLGATIKVINEINESLDQIKGATKIIQQISSQTNLLAMNAAIEAAHAGDAGRGFAVVADEIRKLAEASSINSKQINGVIKDVVSRIEIASASGKETEIAFSDIDKEVEGVAQSLDEISSSMSELNVGGKQILEAMTGLQDVSDHVNQGSRDMTEASDKMTGAIEIVSRITSEVSNSANEITIGITEVSGAMTLVTELSGNLGEITDTLEKESACFKTEKSDIVDDSCAEILSNDNSEVTISGDDEELEIENME